MSDTSRLTGTEKKFNLAEQNYKRDLYYSATIPTQRCETGEDNRILALDTQRRPLPTQERIKIALENVTSTEAIADMRRVLLDTITLDADLAQLLAAPQFRLVRDRLMALTVQPTNAVDDGEVLFFYPHIRHACTYNTMMAQPISVLQSCSFFRFMHEPPYNVTLYAIS